MPCISPLLELGVFQLSLFSLGRKGKDLMLDYDKESKSTEFAL